MGNVILAGDPAAAAACARRVTTAAQVRGVLGPWRCVTAAVDQLELTAQPVLSGAPEILYRLDISVLRDPVSAVRCRRATKEDLDWLTPWRVAYAVETLGAKPGPDVEPTVFANLCDQIAEGRLFVAHREEEPVATCCFNAELPDVVQIGAVWTPPTMRGRGYARAVVAGALRIAQQEGVMRAVLFTEETNTPAQRAYEALGFARVGDYGMMLYDLN
jgi:predicted GNAT family acetyltransferase